MYKSFLKPFLDFTIAVTGLIIFSPLFLLLTVLLCIANHGKPFFLQLRPGKNEKLFKVIKFKTMNDRTDDYGQLLPDSERLTNVGAFIRKTSLDEIPQLLNVLMGDMSLVGPRPLLPEYLPLYDKEQQKRHSLRPGITGWAQVNGRNVLSWDQKFKLDVWYVEQVSLLLDIRILFRTVKKVFVSEGISADGHVSTEKFKGNNYAA